MIVIQGDASHKISNGNGNLATEAKNAGSNNTPLSETEKHSSYSSSQLLARRKRFAESTTGRSSFAKLIDPSLIQVPGIAPYRIVLENVKEKVEIFSFSSVIMIFVRYLVCVTIVV